MFTRRIELDMLADQKKTMDNMIILAEYRDDDTMDLEIASQKLGQILERHDHQTGVRYKGAINQR